MSGSGTNRTSIDLPKKVSDTIIQKVQEESAIMQLASSISLPGTGMTIPMITDDPEPEWVAETGQKPVSNPTLDTKVMIPYKMAVIVPFSDEFKRDYAALYDALEARLPGVMAQKFDRTVFHGTAPGTGFDVLTGCTAQSIDVNASGEGGFYKALVASDMDISDNGGMIDGFAMSPQARGEMLSALDKDGRPIFINNVSEGAVPKLIGQTVKYSRGLYAAGNAATSGVEAKPDTLGFAGDWTKAQYGIVQAITIDVSNQATLQAGTGIINLWQRNMFAIKAEMEIGFIADTTCFNKIVRTHKA